MEGTDVGAIIIIYIKVFFQNVTKSIIMFLIRYTDIAAYIYVDHCMHMHARFHMSNTHCS